jgi:hypothetical protein
MEQVPHVAMYCHEEKDEHQWMHLVPSFLLPLVVRYLTDVNNQVGFYSFCLFYFYLFIHRLGLFLKLEWNRFVKQLRPPFWCFSNKNLWLTTTSKIKSVHFCSC